MGENSRIEWTHHTFNPWWGCVRVSPACEHCYAETFSRRVGLKVWGVTTERRFFGDKHWSEPVKWNAKAEEAGERRRVFCASMADVFEIHADPHVHAEMQVARQRLWALIQATPALDWLLLTKRPENIVALAPGDWDIPRPNVWIGTTVENQRYENERIPILQNVPAVVRFLSCEPLLGPINLDGLWGYPGSANVDQLARWPIKLVIAGGESGPGARPMHPDWARSLRDQCQVAGVPFHFKQWGEWQDGSKLPGFSGEIVLNNGRHARYAEEFSQEDRSYWSNRHAVMMAKVGKKAAGRLLDGREWNEFPEARQ